MNTSEGEREKARDEGLFSRQGRAKLHNAMRGKAGRMEASCLGVAQAWPIFVADLI